MNEEENNALKVIKARTKRLLDELEIEKEDMSDEPRIAYLMQEIRANKIILNLIERLQKENEEYKRLAEMNLKNAEEFKDNMCEHRCLLKNENEELKADNEQIRTEVNSLEKENETLKNKLSLKHFDINVVYNDYLEKLNEYQKNSIPVQKVKDKIEKLNDESHAEELEDIMDGENYTITELVQYVLQELIEEREVK